ncbi:MAG: methylenetetrahydrofolate reductase [NAD(P)H] [Burkholderiales bacterium]|jgi:methylenetetrahydrofolate reductase (NADPH)|nr:methylenetetrahydrofolate reductase [NAD(P)H] [Burkholderiales bacterium]
MEKKPFPGFSVEFFPPKSEEGNTKLRATWQKLAALSPEFCSVTFGAGGSTKQGTLATVKAIRADGLDGVPHLSCVGNTREQIFETIESYRQADIHHMVALRGDLPSGMGAIGAFQYASDLIAYIRRTTGDWFHIDVAAYPEIHPQARSGYDDIRHLKHKFENGANSAITQYFYNADAYFHFRDRCAQSGIHQPIIPGIMPIFSYSRLVRFSDMCGAEIPRYMRRQMEAYGDDADSIRAFGLDVVTAMCERLLKAGVPGLHFYTMNQSSLVMEICERLALGDHSTPAFSSASSPT